jgi:hypothetical protein
VLLAKKTLRLLKKEYNNKPSTAKVLPMGEDLGGAKLHFLSALCELCGRICFIHQQDENNNFPSFRQFFIK